MAADHESPTRPALAVKIYCPVEPATWQALLSGDLQALEADAAAGAMIGIIRGPNPLGDFGLYKGVFEVALGLESFIPSTAAAPAAGTAGAASIVPSVVITTFVAEEVDEKELARAIEELVRAHPWEVPVIEVATSELLLRRRG